MLLNYLKTVAQQQKQRRRAFSHSYHQATGNEREVLDRERRYCCRSTLVVLPRNRPDSYSKTVCVGCLRLTNVGFYSFATSLTLHRLMYWRDFIESVQDQKIGGEGASQISRSQKIGDYCPVLGTAWVLNDSTN